MKKRSALFAGIAALAPTAAWAHPGNDGAGGLLAGVAHPLTGADHLVAMLLVGIWAGLLAPERRGALLIPIGFLAAMIAGFLASALLGSSLAEPVILLSLAVLGMAAAFKLRPPIELAVAAAASFGFAHGLAHGFETPQGAFSPLFALGFLLCTAALHGAGLTLAKLLPVPIIRALSAAAAATALAAAATA